MTGLLLVTHGRLGEDLLETVREILDGCPMQARALAVPGDSDPDAVLVEARELCDTLDGGDGVLVLTDLFGSTPSNVARRLIETHNVRIISGVNVPMLIRILNYPTLALDALAEKAADGARDGIVVTSHKQAS